MRRYLESITAFGIGLAWLLGDNSPLFDIQRPIKDSLVLPLASYSLKNVCKHPKLVNYQWQDRDSGSQWSIVQFAEFLNAPDAMARERIKTNILTYNFDDVMASRMLEVWLRSLQSAPAVTQSA